MTLTGGTGKTTVAGTEVLPPTATGTETAGIGICHASC